MRTRLYAAAVSTKTTAPGRDRDDVSCRKPPAVLIQPNGFSIRLRSMVLMRNPGMSGRARIDRRAAAGIVLRDVRGAAAFTTGGNQLGGVLSDIIEHERTELIVRPGDGEGLASALSRLIEDRDLRRGPGEDAKALHRKIQV